MPNPQPHTWKAKLKRWVVEPIRNQLRKGASPGKLAWAITLGIVLGINPILGSTSIVCFAAGCLFKLNQPVLHLFKTLTYPLQLALVLVFIKAGQHLNNVPLLPLSITELISEMKAGPRAFLKDFGITMLYGLEAWALSALVLIPLIYLTSYPLLKFLARQKSARTSVRATDT